MVISIERIFTFRIILPIFIIALSGQVSAQLDSYVPYQSLLSINPSFAGSNGYIRNQTGLQSQATAAGTYFGVHNTFDAYSSALKSGIALSTNFDGDDIGKQKHTEIKLAYSKYFTLGKDLKIIPSLQGGYAVNEINLGYHTTSVYLAPGTNSSWVQAAYFSLNSGLLLNFKNFYGGLSVFYLNNPDAGIFTEERVPPQYTLHASYNMKLSEKLQFNFYGQVRTQKNNTSSTLSVNALCFKYFIYGLTYQPGNNASMNAGYRTNYFSMQACYNRNINGLVPETYNGSWQLMLSFNLRNNEQRNSIGNFEAW